MQPPETETQIWRILLFARDGAELLVLRSASGFRLPELRVPRWQRIAANLNAEAKRLWHLDTACLFSCDVPPATVPGPQCEYHVMELCKTEDLTSVAPDFLSISALKEGSFADARDFVAVRQAMGLDGASFPDECRGPFSGFGALSKISTWVHAKLHPLGLGLDGCFRQLQASASFALIRFQTNKDAVWFKAVGKPNLREFPITVELTARFPAYLPEPIAICSEWNGWLVKEASGQDLFACTEAAPWQRVAKSLAELQIAAIPYAAPILAAGAHDVSVRRLLTLTAPFFQVLKPLMKEQAKPVPPALSAEELDDVKHDVVSALQQTESIPIPDTLNHLDLNPGNVFVFSQKCTFLDWAEAAVGNPFFSLEYLRQHFRRTFPASERDDAQLCNSYLSHWSSILPSKAGVEMLRLAPLTALFAYAATALPWNEPKQTNQPNLAAFLRSLARRMRQEAEQLKSIRTA